MRVAPAASAARTRQTVLPSRTSSPSLSCSLPEMRRSLTNVPLVEPRSSIAIAPPCSRIAACRRDTSGSASTMSVPSRPITAPGVASTSRPSIGRCSTNTSDPFKSVVPLSSVRADGGDPHHVSVRRSGRWSLLRILLERAQHRPAHVVGHLGAVGERVGRLLLEMRPEDPHALLVRERRGPRQALAHHAAEGVDVALSGHLLAADLLG